MSLITAASISACAITGAKAPSSKAAPSPLAPRFITATRRSIDIAPLISPPTASTPPGFHTLDQSRNSNYQAFFIENIFRFGKFHIVPSFRLDHESVDVDTNIGPTLGSRSADHTVPLWGIGLGNDFGHLNETYFSASSGWRPTRYFDVSSPVPATERRQRA